MKEVSINVSEEMYNEIEQLKLSGFNFDDLVQESCEKMIKEFKDNPDEFIKKVNEFENKFQAENGIN